MPVRWISELSRHAHVLLIVPLVVIVMTWPTFARIFDTGEFWLVNDHPDHWLRFWDAWHLERVLSGQADYYFTDAIFHPQGLSLTFHGTSTPAVFLLLLLQTVIPASNAYNLIFLFVLCFNAFSAYVLTRHLFDDKWIGLFGAVVFALCVPFPGGSTTPDLIMIGTLPLTVYFFRRSILEKRWHLAVLAGACAGVTAFIGVYTFVFLLMTIGIYTWFLAASRWRRRSFWRLVLLFSVICCAIGFFRFYPLLVDTAVLKEGMERFSGRSSGSEILSHFVPAKNPFTSEFLRSVFNVAPGAKLADTYLGYINLFLMACAIFHKALWRRLIPWLAILACFAILGLGHFLKINAREYQDVLLPLHFLRKWLPALFGQIHNIGIYQIGVVLPLTVLSCFGLWRLLQSKRAMTRVLVALVSTLVVTIEFYETQNGVTINPNHTTYIHWLRSENDGAGTLINLPRWRAYSTYYLYLQTRTQHPLVLGHAYRNPVVARGYVSGNLLLRRWDENKSVHCLPHNERTFIAALDQLLKDDATHVVVHRWLYGEQFIIHSFRNTPAAYDDHFVSVYRLRDFRLSCERLNPTLPRFDHFAASPAAIPGSRSSILSFHPSESIDKDLFAYLTSLFSDWRSLLHLHLDKGEPVIQVAGASSADLDSFARDNQVIYLLYNKRDTDAKALHAHISFDGFKLCHRIEHEDGSVIEQYLSREFSCSLVASSRPMQVDYDNGARLANASIEATRDMLEIQLMWSNLPSEPHAVSLQVFNAEGDKVLGQDSTITDAALARQHINISSLPPGNYVVKLIVYDFNTRVSVPGTVSAESLRFERELEIASVDRT
ncbi:MAG: hypothetical protein OXG53_10385 [Chloroflexi bacterium]|nr:hypothetical protein [Chloroflexota bacterium]